MVVTSLSRILGRRKGAVLYWELGHMDSRLPLAQTSKAETHGRA